MGRFDIRLIDISTYWAILSGLGCSLFFLFYFDPKNDKCLKEADYLKYDIFSECIKIVILVPLLLWTVIYHGGIHRILSFNNIRPGSIIAQQSNDKYLSNIDVVWNAFFDRWILVGVTGLSYAIIGPFNNDDDAKLYTVLQSIISYMFTTWATTGLFNDICLLTKVSNTEITKLWESMKHIQAVCQYFSLLSTIGLIVGVSNKNNEDATTRDTLIVFFVFFRILIEMYSIRSYTMLIKLLHRHSYELILSLTQKIISPNNATSLDVSSSIAAKDIETSSASSGAVSLSKDYASTYYDISKILDLLKMVTTVMYIIVVSLIMLLLIVYYPREVGNYYIDLAMKASSISLPFIYLIIYRRCRTYGSKLSAISKARSFCIFTLYGAVCLFMAATGVNRGCNWLKKYRDDVNIDNRLIVFIAYFIKSMALQTTAMFGLTILTSPGVRGYLTLPDSLKYLLAPSMWPSTYTIQKLHVASGANFFVCGSIHGIIWSILLGSGDVYIYYRRFLGSFKFLVDFRDCEIQY
jgi:hypothetical protein